MNIEHKERIVEKVKQQKKKSWIANVMRIYPDKTFDETETLYNKIFKGNGTQDRDNPCISNLR